ncbi:hypothetical protein [Salmonirosea aquatica]|uniref:Uncharacterized protein n=1 Tax=Salmonirosea aquatica TaxID=2654236 RepID=A0A7C9BL52_9BACT|nr:hypothetical protein [Cytophagaceae bacterium SJW1-29]
MKRSNRILLSLVAAAVTFGSLYAFMGRPPGFSYRNHFDGREGCRDWSYRKSGDHPDRSTQNRASSEPAPTENQ